MRFPYKHISLSSAAISFGRSMGTTSPILSVTLIGPSDSRLREGLLDSGADDTIFPESLAALLGVDLSNAPVGRATTATLANVPLRYARLTLRITDGKEQREWPTWIGFTSAKLHQPLLGFAGFLQFFTATFHGDREQVELTVNNLYPGT